MAFTYDPDDEFAEIQQLPAFDSDMELDVSQNMEMGNVPEPDLGKGFAEKAQMAGAAAQLVGAGIGMLDKTEEVDAPNYISDMLGMAGQGASMGASFGPWGVGIGAAVGAGAGLIKATTEDKATNARIQERKTQERKFAQAASTTQTNPMFAEQGMKAPSKAQGYLENMKIRNLNMPKSKDREASISAKPYSYIGYNKGFTGTAGVRGQGYLPLGDIGSASLGYDASATLSRQGLQGRGNLNLSADLNPTDRLNISPYATFGTSSIGESFGFGATARYRFDEGGKVKYTDKAKYEQAMRERQEAIDMYNRGLEWYLEDIDWSSSHMGRSDIRRANMEGKYRQAGIAGEKYIQEIGGRLGGSPTTAYSFEVFPYPTQTPYYEEPPPPPSYIPFVTESGDTLRMSGDIQGTGADRALEEGWDSRISYLNQLNQLAGK